MFHGFWSGQLTAFSYMSYYQYRYVAGLAYFHQFIAAQPDLRNAAGRRVYFVAVHSLYRIYYKKIRLSVFTDYIYVLHVGLRQHEKIIGNRSADAIGSHLYLLVGLLSRNIQNVFACFGDVGSGLNYNGRFSYTRFSGNED